MEKDIISWIAVFVYFSLIIGGIMTEFFNPLEYSFLLAIGLFLIYLGIKGD